MIFLLGLYKIILMDMISSILAGMIGGWELIAILIIVLLIFGGTKIPQLMKGLGQGISEFKKGMKDGDQVVNDDKKDTKFN
jgi:sec-independent protein translocase protein TatA